MTMPAVQSGDRESALAWDFMRLGFARRVASLAAFGVIYSTLMILGLFLRESSQQLTIIWPAAGLLFMALWFSPRRNWIWIVGTQMALEIAIDFSRVDHFTLRTYGPFIVANSLDGIVGAFIAGRLMATPEIPRVRHVLQSAVVKVTQTPDELCVVVEDRGVGFEWQLSLFEPRSEGFGLWSVADRVRAAAGEMTVDTAPGRGCRVSVRFPHNPVRPLIQRSDPPHPVADFRK